MQISFAGSYVGSILGALSLKSLKLYSGYQTKSGEGVNLKSSQPYNSSFTPLTPQATGTSALSNSFTYSYKLGTSTYSGTAALKNSFIEIGPAGSLTKLTSSLNQYNTLVSQSKNGETVIFADPTKFLNSSKTAFVERSRRDAVLDNAPVSGAPLVGKYSWKSSYKMNGTTTEQKSSSSDYLGGLSILNASSATSKWFTQNLVIAKVDSASSFTSQAGSLKNQTFTDYYSNFLIDSSGLLLGSSESSRTFTETTGFDVLNSYAYNKIEILEYDNTRLANFLPRLSAFKTTLDNIIGSKIGRVGGVAYIVGTNYSDNLVGTANNDLIISNGGKDILSGLGGADAYLINTTDAVTIHNYQDNSDKILFDAVAFASLKSGLTSANLLSSKTATKSATATQFLIFNEANQSLYYDADASGSKSNPMLIAKFTGTVLAASQFTTTDVIVV